MTLVVLRHGQTDANVKGIYSGWNDDDLNKSGIAGARQAGLLLKKEMIVPDLVCCSYLKRSIRTAWTILDEIDQMQVPVIQSWRLNECHCGAFTGLTPMQMKSKYGAESFLNWRHQFTTPPPMLPESSPLNPKRNLKYRGIEAPLGESLSMGWDRLLPFWTETIIPSLAQGQTVLVVTHGNLLRAIMKNVERLTEEEIMSKKVAGNCVPLVYKYDGSEFNNKKILRK